MKVILHIGTEKTGTSSIQHFLHLNRRRLPKYGFHVLRSAGDYDQCALAVYTRSNDEADDYLAAQGIKSIKDREEFRAGLERALDKELTSLPSSTHSVIISSEHFHSTLQTDQSMDRLQKLLSKYFQEVKVICYLREQGAVATSLYSTALKGGLCRTQEAYIQRQCRPQNYYFNYWQLLSRWEKAFGEDALNVAIYDKAEFLNGELIEDFTGRVDSTLLGQLESYKLLQNQSLSPEGQRLLLGVNCAFARTQGNVEEIRVLCREEIYTLLKGRGQQLDLPTRKSIYESFLASNTAVQEKYFPGRGVLFPEPDQVLLKDEEFSDNGKRALDKVLKAVSHHGGLVLDPEAVRDAQHLIKEIYLGNAGIPFDWNNVNLFGKGILKAGDDGILRAQIVIRNTSSESLEFSKSTKSPYSIGWQVQSEEGGLVDNLHGTVDVEATIPAGTFRAISISFSLENEGLATQKALGIEFCVVDDCNWLNRKYPLNSAWSVLVLQS